MVLPFGLLCTSPHTTLSLLQFYMKTFFYFPELLDQAVRADLLQHDDESVGAAGGVSSSCAVAAPWTVPANSHHHSSLHS